MHQRGDEFRQPAEVMLERDGPDPSFAAEQDLVAIHRVECRKGHRYSTLLRRCSSSMVLFTLYAENRPTPTASRISDPATSNQFVLCGQDHRSSQGWLPRARARLAGVAPIQHAFCLTSFFFGKEYAPVHLERKPHSFSVPTPMHGKDRIQKHGLRNTLESIVPAHKCQTVMIPCPAFWNPVSVFSVLLFFLFPFTAGWLGKTEPRKSGASRLSGTFRPYR